MYVAVVLMLMSRQIEASQKSGGRNGGTDSDGTHLDALHGDTNR
jgi:hypothetical protein